MGKARVTLRVTQPLSGTANILSATTYFGAGVVGATQAAKGSTVAAVQSVTKILPGFAIAKGVIDIVQGVALIWDTNEQDKSYKGILGSGLAADPQKPVYITPRFTYSTPERWLRGGLKTLSGAFLLDGGIEALAHTDSMGLNALGVSLLWRMAISSMADFALALHDLGKFGTSLLTNPDTIKTSARDVLSEFFIKGFAAAGWTLLAIGSNPVVAISNPIYLTVGLACLALSVGGTLYHNRANIGQFFTGMKEAVKDKDGPRAGIRKAFT